MDIQALRKSFHTVMKPKISLGLQTCLDQDGKFGKRLCGFNRSLGNLWSYLLDSLENFRINTT
jgi:hypothetical protein